MVSEYEYASVASLELFASEDYGLIDATFLTDGHVESKITAAEWIVNTFCGQSFTGTIPDGVKYATHDIAKRLIYTWMREHGMKLDKEKLLASKLPLLTPEIEGLLGIFKSQTTVPVKLHRLYNNDLGVYY